MTHAFFKALLFLAAGTVILALDHEHDIQRMGGLRTRLPVAFWSFLIGGCALAALPLITAGFYSKDLILAEAWSGPHGSRILWLAGWIGALLTGAYIFRAIFIAFFGTAKTEPTARPGWRMALPLVVLSVLSVIGGFVEMPRLFGDVHLFSSFLAPVLPSMPQAASETTEIAIALLSIVASLGGIYAGYLYFMAHRDRAARLVQNPAGAALRAFWHGGWGFDTLYDRLFVRPYIAGARANRDDFVDRLYDGLAAICRALYAMLARTQDGLLRHYAHGIAIGAAIVVALALALW
jgi:NADH-quinone oxidoreductase subunit L